jgi:hypothetical protein
MTIFAPPSMNPLPMSVEWYLRRQAQTIEARNGREGYTLGVLEYGLPEQRRSVYCVEDQDRRLEEGNGNPNGLASCIPLGRYRLTIHQSPQHGHQVIKTHAVPGFSGVEINARSEDERLFGCIAVGVERMFDGVRNSQPALSFLIAELRKMNMREIGVYLNVVRS